MSRPPSPDLRALADFVTRLTGPKSPFALVMGQDGPQFVSGPQTLVEVYRRARRMAAAPLVILGDKAISYAEILEPGLALAGALRRRDLQGRRIAVDLEDKVEWLRWFVAITAAGASAVLVPAQSGQGEVAVYLDAADCHLIVTRRDRPYAGVENLLGLTTTDAVEEWTLAPEAEALVAFTSGSTGVPKGVRHSQRGLLAGQKNMMLLGAVVGKLAVQPDAPPADARPTGAPTPLIVAPLSYVAGYSAFLLALSTGGRIALSQGVVTVEEACALVERWALSSIVGAGDDFIRRLIRTPAASSKLSSLRRLQFHGAGLRTEIRREVAEALPDVQILTGYGLTETCGAVASAPARLVPDDAGGGWLSPGVAYRLAPADPTSGLPEAAGYLELRGEMVMLGYLNPVQNTAAFTPDGWFRTDDFCDVTDDGWLTVAERPRGLIGPEGAAAPRLMLEAAIRDITGVDEAVVDALEDGETLRVVVQARAGQEISDIQIVRALSERALWTGPVLVEARETLPRTASGKLDRGRALS